VADIDGSGTRPTGPDAEAVSESSGPVTERGRASPDHPELWFAFTVFEGITKRGAATALGLLLVASTVCGGCTSSSNAAPRSGNVARVAREAIVSVNRTPVPSSGCRSPAGASVTDQLQGVFVDGVPRWYLLTTPAPGTPSPTADATTAPATTPVARPLVLDFHGLAEGASLHSESTRFGALGQHDGFVVAFPEGTDDPVRWNTTDVSPSNPDLQFVAALLGALESTLCIDMSRVYASGFSQGAYMVSLLACTMSDRFAAIGAVSGLQLPSPCTTSRRVPVITFHGTADPILDFNGGVGTANLDRLLGGGQPVEPPSAASGPAKLNGPGIPAAVRTWAARDGCDDDPADTLLSSQVILRRYRCPPDTAVEFYIIVGGGHSWPGTNVSEAPAADVGMTTSQTDATSVMWAFFHRFEL
jgi:polyhydroxybutyrate depolymerase